MGAFSDGFLILRYLVGFQGDNLIDQAVSPDAARNGAEIAAYLERISTAGTLDIDGNGTVGAFSDGFLILRYLVGFQGDNLIDQAVSPDATRTTADEIENAIQAVLPPSLTSGRVGLSSLNDVVTNNGDVLNSQFLLPEMGANLG